MIQLNELRLGNYFFIGGLDRYVKVSNVFLSHFKCTDENGIDFNNHQYNIKPIELTEEILLKCGFVGQPAVFSFGNDLVIGIGFDFVGIYINKIKDDIELDCPKYLHQLQNLYFALTGKELNIEL